MLLNNKKWVREKLIINRQPVIYMNNETTTDEIDDSDLYTTNNIVIDKLISSNIEYNGIPTKTSMKNTIKNDKLYTYDCFNKNKISIDTLNYKIMIYTINKEREIPFLLYLLKYDDIQNKYGYLDVNTKLNYDQIENHFLTELNLNIKYSGYILYNNIHYVFFESFDIDRLLYQCNQQYIWVLVSELVNYRYIYNIEIDNSISNLFLKYTNLLNIRHADNTICESPVVGYSINIDGMIHFNSDYNIVLDNTKDKKNIKRYAVFLGVMKINNNNLIDNYSLNLLNYDSVYNIFDSTICNLNYVVNVNDEMRYILLSDFKK